jgi:hypothetical protein
VQASDWSISPFPSEALCLSYLSSASTPQLINILFNKIRRRGAKADPFVEKWFKKYTLKGVKTPVAECQACFKWRKAQNTCRQRAHLFECDKYQELTRSEDRSMNQTTLYQFTPSVTVDSVKKA